MNVAVRWRRSIEVIALPLEMAHAAETMRGRVGRSKNSSHGSPRSSGARQGEPADPLPLSVFALRQAGMTPVLRLVAPETRARMLGQLQGSMGNAAVKRFVETPGLHGPKVGSGLIGKLTALLPVGDAPFPVNIDELIDTIRAASLEDRTAAYVDPSVRGNLITHLSEEGRARALSALLEGPSYEPGAEAKDYARLTPEDRQSVDLETNAMFLRETGIARTLVWTAALDKPLARRWLTLRDGVMLAREQRARHRLYLEKLREAIDKLSAARHNLGARFGRAPDRRTSGRLNYDLANWQRIEEVDPEGKADAALRLRDGVPPSVAIDELFDKIDNWALDCGEFVQVAHLYARRHTLGELFDHPALLDKSGGALSFVLRPQGSTGLLQKRLFIRETATEPMTRLPDNVVEKKGVDRLVAEAPVGSRVTWRRNDLSTDSPYFSENTLKLGRDEFAAQGFGRQKVFTRVELELALARVEDNQDADESFVRDHVFIVGIEHYVTP